MYEIPFGKGRQFGSNIPTALDYVIGGWQWNNIITLQTGTPFDLNVNGSVGKLTARMSRDRFPCASTIPPDRASSVAISPLPPSAVAITSALGISVETLSMVRDTTLGIWA